MAKSDPICAGSYTVKWKTQGDSYVLVDVTGAFLPKDVPPSHIKIICQEIPSTKIDQLGSFEVEAVLHHKGTQDNYLHRARWKGCNEEYETWEPASYFYDCTPIRKYWARCNEREPSQGDNLVSKTPTSSKRKSVHCKKRGF